MNTFALKGGDGFGDIRDLPAENGEGLRLEGGRDVGNAQHDAVGVQGQGKIILAQDMQPQHAFVKWPRFIGVRVGAKAMILCEASMLSSGSMRG